MPASKVRDEISSSLESFLEGVLRLGGDGELTFEKPLRRPLARLRVLPARLTLSRIDRCFTRKSTFPPVFRGDAW